MESIEIKYKPFDELDEDIYPMNEWISCVECGGFIDYDGYGYLALKDKKSNIQIYPSQINDPFYIPLLKEFTHVVWYNR